MKKTFIYLILPLAMVACRKVQSEPNIELSPPDIKGKWKLTSERNYGIFGYSPWTLVPGNQQSIIEFGSDSSFHYDASFSYKDLNLDRYTKSTVSSGFYIYATGIPINPLDPLAQFTNHNELILISHGVDTGKEEKYVKLQ